MLGHADAKTPDFPLQDAKGGGRLERRRRQLREASRRFRQKQRDTISTLNDEVADMRRVVFALSQELERHSIPIPRAAKSVVSRELAHHAATDNFVRVFAHASSSTPDSNPSSDTVSRASGSSAAHAGAAKPMHTDVSPTTEGRSARQSLRRSSRSSTSSRVPLERFAHAPYGATRHPHAAVHHPHAGNTPAQGAASVPRHMMYAAPAPSRPGEGQPCARPRPVHSGRSMPGHSARTQRQGAVAKECVYSAPPQTGMAYPQGAMQFPGMPYPGFWGMPPAMQGFGQGQAAAIAAAAAAGDSRAVAAMEGRIPIATDSSHMMYPGQMAPYWGLEQQAASQKAAGLAQGPAGMPFPTASACQDADSYCIPPGMSAAAEPAGLDEGAGEGEERQ